ncbi:hypothetical protein, partial [Zoogloea sp.]|uniref:hypothetical protein n=1 Tax=Zoogloea sp. TaxID=49181 RepID=UPI0037D9BFFA
LHKIWRCEQGCCKHMKVNDIFMEICHIDAIALVSKEGAATVILATPQFGPPTGNDWCTGSVIVPCERRRIAIDIQTTPPGAEIWIDGNKQSLRTNHLVETELEVCDNKVDVLLRFPGKTNCRRKVPLLGASIKRVTCAFAGGAQ